MISISQDSLGNLQEFQYTNHLKQNWLVVGTQWMLINVFILLFFDPFTGISTYGCKSSYIVFLNTFQALLDISFNAFAANEKHFWKLSFCISYFLFLYCQHIFYATSRRTLQLLYLIIHSFESYLFMYSNKTNMMLSPGMMQSHYQRS